MIVRYIDVHLIIIIIIIIIIKHAAPDRVKPSFVIFDIRALDAEPWASECPDVKNYKWRSGTGYFIAVPIWRGHQRVKQQSWIWAVSTAPDRARLNVSHNNRYFRRQHENTTKRKTNPNKSKLVPVNNHSKQTTRGSAIAEEPHIGGTLHWRFSKWIICSWTNAMFWNICLYNSTVTLRTRSLVIQGHWRWHRSIDHIGLQIRIS